MSAWTRERWDHFAQRRHRQGLLQRRSHRKGALLVPKRIGKARPPGAPKSRMEQAHDDWLADNPQSYETCDVVRQRKVIAKRHARRKQRRATQRHMRRKRWGRA